MNTPSKSEGTVYLDCTVCSNQVYPSASLLALRLTIHQGRVQPLRRPSDELHGTEWGTPRRGQVETNVRTLASLADACADHACLDPTRETVLSLLRQILQIFQMTANH